MFKNEKWEEHGIHCLPCAYTNSFRDLSSLQIWHHSDARVTSLGRHSVKGLIKTFDNSVVAMVPEIFDSMV